MNRLGMTYNSLTRLDYKNNPRNPIKIKIGEEEKEYYIVSENISRGSVYDDYTLTSNEVYYSYELHEIRKIKVKTEQEKAAEESVAKAKEALKAAENALKIVKESK